MNETDRQAAIQRYLEEVTEQFDSGHAIEHAYRPALKALMSSFNDTVAVNDPKHSAHGAPDFIFLKKSNTKIIQGYAETKDITVSLDKTEKSEQMKRYSGYANLFLTDYLEFRFLKNGDKYQTISLGHVKDGKLHKTPEHADRLLSELQAFLDLPPEKIKSGKRLAQIMGGKARRIRDNVQRYLSDQNEQNGELEKIYTMMKKLLVHDLSTEKFADMYAQTLVYGLFVARYGDSTPDTFTRAEARDLVPKSNPFLRHFFDHIVGPNFDARLGYIVDELCDVFAISPVQDIVHKHLRIQDDTSDAKDPIIHFYEDFLQEYDPAIRKAMGAYYTPTPVVKFIVRQVDKILKEDFGVAKGLASTDTIQHEVEVGQDMRHDRRSSTKTTQTLTLPKVQVLDPAVGTATFLNETIKFIYEGFKGQEGSWPGYVQNNLVKRLHGFELMMAPYTIAHLKLGMTLKETGVENLNDRLGVYLTNTLEEGVPTQGDMFTMFGLAEAVADESRHAAEIKSERPIMVVMGNPPYSGVSSNDTSYANSLVDKYRVEPGGKHKLQEQKVWLKNDYVKFIAFAESLVRKNGEGIVAMITDHSYLEGPTFRGMRWHLAKSFNKIYVLDLHGNSKKREVAPDGSKDENVFDIMQGVSIVIGVKTNSKPGDADVYHSDIFGTRYEKFNRLDEDIAWKKLVLDKKIYYFDDKDISGKLDYDKGIFLPSLFLQKSLGFMTGRDKFATDFLMEPLSARIKHFYDKNLSSEEAESSFGIKDFRKFVIEKFKNEHQYEPQIIKKFLSRPFDNRYVYYQQYLVQEWQNRVMQHAQHTDNTSLIVGRQSVAAGGPSWDVVFVADSMIDLNIFRRGGGVDFPLYLYHDDGTRTVNFDSTEHSALTRNLTSEPSPEDVLDYIYAVLHSPNYREKYKEFLKTDFPRIPAAKNDTEFMRLVGFGNQLRELHLMKSPLSHELITTYPEVGDNIVEKIQKVERVVLAPDCDEGSPEYKAAAAEYNANKGRIDVYINESQYFGSVPELAWNFYIGGYQPAQKWLKDRKGRALSFDDIEHYQRIIKILVETDRIMKLIDE